LYLDRPRLNFSGQFYTNVSTINNTTSNYDRVDPTTVGWNPNGRALYRIVGGTVGSVQARTQDTSMMGAAVSSTNSPNPGKLVDIDPDQQALSQVIGVQLQVKTPSGAGFTGTLVPCNLQDMWTRSLTGKGKAGGRQASASFISVLEDVVWTNVEQSAFLQELQAATVPNRLAIRFVLDSYFFGEVTDPTSGLGRIVGTIGPFTEGQPTQFVTRRLVPNQSQTTKVTLADTEEPVGHDNVPMVRASTRRRVSTRSLPPMQACNFQLDVSSSRLTIDLGNSIQNTTFGGEPVPVGLLRVVLTGADGSVTPLGKPFPYTATDNIATAGIFDISLTADQAAKAARTPVGLQVQPPGQKAWNTVLAEDAQGRYANVAPFTLRVVAGAVQEVTVQAFQWGQPLAGESLTLTGTVSEDDSGNPTGTPAQLDIQGSQGPGVSVTDAQGRATFRLVTVNPTLKPIRQHLDSLVYLLTGPWVTWGGGLLAQGIQPAALLVWAPYPRAGVANPTWEEDVQPIFNQYMMLYPGMKQILDLTNEQVVRQHLQPLLNVLSLPFEHPGTMPVTRDLSPQKIEVIKTWIRSQLAG